MREKITSMVFVAILLGFFALIILPEDKEASVQENRPLAEMPEITLENILSGKFCSDYETYITDNVAFRSKFVELGTKLEEMRGIQKKDTGRIVDLPSGTRLVLNDGKIMEIYKEQPEVLEKYIRVLNKYSESFSDKSDIYLMLVPTQIEFDKSQYKSLADSEKKTIDTVYSALNNVKTINVYDKLKNHTDEYIYFRTDHHWTQRGGYYGYQAIMEEKGEKPVPLEEMTAKKLDGFLGYLYNQANVKEYAEYADEIEYFEGSKNYEITIKGIENDVPFEYIKHIYNPPEEGAAVTYGLFMDGDHQFAEINTDVKNGEVALVIKDSYANTVIPLLTNNYETILVIDPRSYKGTVTQLANEYEIDDIIFINYALTTTFSSFIDSVDAIM